VNVIDGQPIGGVTIRIGSRTAVSGADGSFNVDNLEPGKQQAVLSAPFVIERRTTVTMPMADAVQQSLIPAQFDLNAFDEMFRSNGRLERWTSAPVLVVLTTVMNYEKSFGDGREYRASSEQLTEAETDLLVTHLTDALALLTGNTFTTFASVQRESAASNALVNTIRTGKIVVGRYKGVMGLANTIGFGGWIPDDNGQVTAGAIYLDRDFDKASDQRRLLRTHELGHALGYNHVTTRTSIMNPAIGPEPTAFDEQGAVIAFRRSPGNESPDSDPATNSSRKSGGIFTIAPLQK
jgi:hypothetical protein